MVHRVLGGSETGRKRKKNENEKRNNEDHDGEMGGKG